MLLSIINLVINKKTPEKLIPGESCKTNKTGFLYLIIYNQLVLILLNDIFIQHHKYYNHLQMNKEYQYKLQ